jgi:hypothetical protein
MAIAEIYTKKKLMDITERENSIDVEYVNRLRKLKSISDFRELMKDYEEFLPYGIIKYSEEMDDKLFLKLQRGIERVFLKIKNKEPIPAEPSIEMIIIMPPFLTMVRALAFSKTRDRLLKNNNNKCGNIVDFKNVVTWGQSFLDLNTEGRLTLLLQRQDHIYNQAVASRDIVSEMIDTES